MNNKIKWPGSIMEQPFPKTDDSFKIEDFQESIEAMERMKSIVMAIRNIRGEHNIPQNKKIPFIIINAQTFDEKFDKDFCPIICSLAKVEKIVWQVDSEPIDKEKYITVPYDDSIVFNISINKKCLI